MGSWPPVRKHQAAADVAMADGMEGAVEGVEGRGGAVALIYMFIALQRKKVQRLFVCI